MNFRSKSPDKLLHIYLRSMKEKSRKKKKESVERKEKKRAKEEEGLGTMMLM